MRSKDKIASMMSAGPLGRSAEVIASSTPTPQDAVLARETLGEYAGTRIAVDTREVACARVRRVA